MTNFLLSTKIKLIAHFNTIRKVGEAMSEEKFSWIKTIFATWGILAVAFFFLCLIPAFCWGLCQAINGKGTEDWVEYFKNDVVRGFQTTLQNDLDRSGGWALIGYSFILPLVPGGLAGVFIGGYIGSALPFNVAFVIVLLTIFVLLGEASTGGAGGVGGLFAISGDIDVFFGLGGTVVTVMGIGTIIFL